MAEGLEATRRAIDKAIGTWTLVDLLDRNAANFGDLTAIRWVEDGEPRSLTWSAYRDQVVAIAAGLRSGGVGAGDFVAIMGSNRPEHVIADLAAVYAGAVPVSLYNTLASDQIRYIADHCSAKVAIVENRDYLQRWSDIRENLPALDRMVVMDPEDADQPGLISWDDLLAEGKETLRRDPELVGGTSAAVNQEDLATLIYTSGTTGDPKGVMVSHRNLLWTLACLDRTFPLPENPRLMSYLPLAHIGERLASHYGGLWWAAEVRYVADLSGVAEAIAEARPHVFFAVPRVWEKFHAGLMARVKAEPNARRRALALGAISLATEAQRAAQEGRAVGLVDRLKLRLFDRILFSKRFRHGLGMDELRLAVSAAAPISPEFLLFFRGIGLPVVELYGMTESSGPGTTNVEGANRIGTVGRAMPGVEVKVAEDGEILLRGGLITEGYYRDPETTAATYGKDGWLRTGDLGRLDDHGYLTITGRKKEIIITAGGKNVAPARLENLINEHPLVAQACVVGDGRRYLTLLVALDPEMVEGWAKERGMGDAGFEDLTRHPDVRGEVEQAVKSANAKVSRVEQARKWTVVSEAWSVDTGELTPSLKMKRRVVLERYDSQIAQLYDE